MLLFLIALNKNTINILILLLSMCAFVSTAKVKPYFCSEPHSADGYDEPVVWRCAGQMPLWSYNCGLDACVEFRYGGCGGNDNSFYTKEECEDTCKG